RNIAIACGDEIPYFLFRPLSIVNGDPVSFSPSVHLLKMLAAEIAIRALDDQACGLIGPESVLERLDHAHGILALKPAMEVKNEKIDKLVVLNSKPAASFRSGTRRFWFEHNWYSNYRYGRDGR